MFAGHVPQVRLPMSHVPAAQTLHTLAPAALVVPAGHGRQSDAAIPPAAPCRNVPALHGTQLNDVRVTYCPDVQCVQVGAPGLAKESSPHTIHTVPSVEKVLAGQALQTTAVRFVALGKNPGAHGRGTHVTPSMDVIFGSPQLAQRAGSPSPVANLLLSATPTLRNDPPLHVTQCVLPAAEIRPAAHGAHVIAFRRKVPAGHGAQVAVAATPVRSKPM